MRTLEDYGHARDALLDRIVRRLDSDDRVVAAWLSGSFGRGEADEWADLDLEIAVRDEAYAAFFGERLALYQAVGHPTLIQEEMPSSWPREGMVDGRFQLVIFEGLIEVDWNFGPASKALRPVAHMPLIERSHIPVVAPPSLTPEQRRNRAQSQLTFFWAMAPIAIKYAGRRDTRRAANQITLLMRALIDLWRLAHYPDGPEPYLPSTNRILEPELQEWLPGFREMINPLIALDVIERLCNRAVELHVDLNKFGVVHPDEMLEPIGNLLDMARDEARTSAIPDQRRAAHR